ncbi:helix-turn-helix transcriptional regulator [Enterococcus durans]|uniref:helix-turn-helix transcriptional regulator n=1 Tax=Enterococcus durans TaxID=53345 RepID=UPI0039A54792
MTFGEGIKKLRVSQDLTQAQLAERIFVTRQTISNWENDKGQPELENLILLSELFHVSLDELIQAPNEKNKQVDKRKIGRDFLIIFLIWSVIMLAVQLVLHPFSMKYVLIYSLGGTLIVSEYLRRTKRLANVYAQGENMYDLGIYLWIFFIVMDLIILLIQSEYIL